MASLSIPCIAQIDLHSHAVTQGYLEIIKANGAEMDEGFPIPGWDVERHIAFMDKADIQTAVLTMPAPQPYFGGGIAVQSCPAPLQGHETMLQKRFAMVRGRFAAVQCPMQWCETDLHDCKRVLQWCEAKLHGNGNFPPHCGQ